MNFGQKNSALFIIFFIFSEKAGPVPYFTAAFNVPNIHPIWQKLHANDPLQPYMAWLGWMTTKRRQRRPKLANSVSLFLQIWQLRMPTLSQQFGSFPTESRAEMFFKCRQDFPLPPPLNKVGFHGLREEKTGSKVSKKTSFFGFCTVLSLLSLSTVAFSHHHPHYRSSNH